ncbi:hypothetical protein QBC35DRAFT_517484 [Podospora australis]|uniref:Thioredoxin domain-containing protein n=1 Tax=Podospora australis TaxID=1536484 RepID=A0AAN7AG36_9PEZI|nr:hypothetical protein QBC35DRAFT_517484 [Podospora australis]
MSGPVHISSSSQWRTTIAANSVVIADFYADWCGPCKMIAPHFESLANKYTKPRKIAFVKVNVDNQGDVAQQYNVRAMPTFLVLHNGSVVNTIQGANPPGLTAAVEKAVKLAGPGVGSGASFAGTAGQRLGGSSVGGGRTTGATGGSLARPVSWDLNNLVNLLVNFFGLYFVSLFSLDPYKAAENSPYNTHNPPPKPQPNRCPGCRAQILGFYDALLLPRSTTSRPFLHTRAPRATAVSAPRSHQRPASFRQFSTSRPILQETTSSNDGNTSEAHETTESSSVEEIELLVRQARQTFGNTLPKDYLSAEEYKVYERLYGPPLRETAPEDVGIPFKGASGEIIDSSTPQHALFRTLDDGMVEEVTYTIDRPSDAEVEAEAETGAETEAEVEGLEVSQGLETAKLRPPPVIEYLNIAAKNQREFNALLQLQADFEAAASQPRKKRESKVSRQKQEEHSPEDELRQEELEDEEVMERSNDPRVHPYTSMGRFKTFPSTLQLPKVKFIEPITELLKRTSTTHLIETAEKKLGGVPLLPYGPSTPKTKTNLPQKGLALQAGHHRMSEIEADTFIAAVLPPMYSSVMSTLVEVRKRLGSGWLQGLLERTDEKDGKGPRVLDVGAGGAGLAAWQQVLQAEWDVLREKGEVKGREPPGKKTVLVGSDHLRHRISRFLHNTTFLPRLPDYVHISKEHKKHIDAGDEQAPRKIFDVIIASHLLMPLEQEFKRKEMIDNLWSMLNPDGGVLIVMEKGHPRGFEAVADVRQRILDELIIPPTSEQHPQEVNAVPPEHIRHPGMIVAPCTNHSKCPMYHHPGLSPGRKDFCHFTQRYHRPPFLQKLVGGSHKSHEDINFSYVAVRRGYHPEGHTSAASSSSEASTETSPPVYLQGKAALDRAFQGYEKSYPTPPHPLSLPRNILPPIKSHGHVTLDLCTPEATIERWIVPRSFSKQAYHDARKTVWGDLWALGAKTRTMRNVRLGRAGEDATVVQDGGVRSKRAAAGAKKQRNVVDINVHAGLGVVSAIERNQDIKRRTKGGRKMTLDNLFSELGYDDEKDADDMEDEDFMRGKGTGKGDQ